MGKRAKRALDKARARSSFAPDPFPHRYTLFSPTGWFFVLPATRLKFRQGCVCIMVPVIALVVALVPLAVTGGEVYRPVVRRAYPPLQRRLEFVGAAPLLALKCPSDLKECSSTSRAMGMCCPKTTTCVLSFCCPTGMPSAVPHPPSPHPR